MPYILDPLEQLEAAQERAAEGYIDEHTCMVCPHPLGLAPAMCYECAGIEEHPTKST